MATQNDTKGDRNWSKKGQNKPKRSKKAPELALFNQKWAKTTPKKI